MRLLHRYTRARIMATRPLNRTASGRTVQGYTVSIAIRATYCIKLPFLPQSVYHSNVWTGLSQNQTTIFCHFSTALFIHNSRVHFVRRLLRISISLLFGLPPLFSYLSPHQKTMSKSYPRRESCMWENTLIRKVYRLTCIHQE
jgi:hypothetical protein